MLSAPHTDETGREGARYKLCTRKGEIHELSSEIVIFPLEPREVTVPILKSSKIVATFQVLVEMMGTVMYCMYG